MLEWREGRKPIWECSYWNIGPENVLYRPAVWQSVWFYWTKSPSEAAENNGVILTEEETLYV